VKILLVDDHALIREALHGVLREVRSDLQLLEAGSAQQALDVLCRNSDIELILLDLYLPDRLGFDLIGELRGNYPSVAVAVLSASTQHEDMVRALDLGALGFIPKSSSHDVMVGAFNLIFSGGVYVPPEIMHRPASNTDIPPHPSRPLSASELGLTERQLEVLALMMLGKSNKLICRALDIAEPTVKNHVTAIMRALKVSNRTEAALVAASLGLAPANKS